MQNQLGNGIGSKIIILLRAAIFQMLSRWRKTIKNDNPASMEDYLYKIARVTGKSEYDVFTKSAEEWPIPREKIESDFESYLTHQTVPYYVRDFVRKNKPHIDDLYMPMYYNPHPCKRACHRNDIFQIIHQKSVYSKSRIIGSFKAAPILLNFSEILTHHLPQ